VEFLTAACCQAESVCFSVPSVARCTRAGQKEKQLLIKRLFEEDAFSLLTAQ
jgi:hypothetical protein